MSLQPYYLPAAPKLLYDGLEKAWLTQPVALLQSDLTPFQALMSRDIHPIEEARKWLGNVAFGRLLSDVKAQVRDWSGQGDIAYLGAGGLHLHYVRNGLEIWVLAAGEYQPARYQTYLHGHWRLASKTAFSENDS